MCNFCISNDPDTQCFLFSPSSHKYQERFLPSATGSWGGLEGGDISQTYQIQFIYHQYPQEIIICLYITFLWALRGSGYEFLPAAFLIPTAELPGKGYPLSITYSNNYWLIATGNSNSLTTFDKDFVLLLCSQMSPHPWRPWTPGWVVGTATLLGSLNGKSLIIWKMKVS